MQDVLLTLPMTTFTDLPNKNLPFLTVPFFFAVHLCLRRPNRMISHDFPFSRHNPCKPFKLLSFIGLWHSEAPRPSFSIKNYGSGLLARIKIGGRLYANCP